MSNELLRIENLSIIYKTDMEIVKAVNGISLSIGRDETLGLVGETGAGKTSTALAILRLLPERTGKITSGKILFGGEDVHGFSDDKLRSMRGAKVSMIFQDPMTSLNPVLSVGRQIGEALVLHNYDNKSAAQIEERIEEILELVGIPAYRKGEYPHQFSGGMKQRVVIAISLSCNPDLLIADEPTTALDVTIQAQVLSMMNDLKKQFGSSLLMISHDLGVIAQTCDNVAVMYAGEIVEYGSAKDIFESDKHHPYTAGLFGSIPKIDEKTERLEQIDGLMPDPTNLPSGCKFHPRCKKCMDICKNAAPPVFTEGMHTIRCHLYA